MVERVLVTEAAAQLLERLRVFMVTCCSTSPGAAAMAVRRCAIRQESSASASRTSIWAASEACPFYMGAAQFEYWRHTQLIIDVVPGRGSGFSLEAPLGVRFLTRSRVFTDEEVADLVRDGPPARGADLLHDSS